MMKPCPIEGCDKKIHRDYFVCGFHWKMIPQPVRDEFWKLVDDWHERDLDGKRELLPVWEKLKQTIIDTLNAQEVSSPV